MNLEENKNFFRHSMYKIRSNDQMKKLQKGTSFPFHNYNDEIFQLNNEITGKYDEIV